jgi:hypothetical protein
MTGPGYSAFSGGQGRNASRGAARLEPAAPPSGAERRGRLTEIAQLAERLAQAVYSYERDSVDYNDDLIPERVTNEGARLPSVLLQLAGRARQLADSRPEADPTALWPHSRKLKPYERDVMIRHLSGEAELILGRRHHRVVAALVSAAFDDPAITEQTVKNVLQKV